MEIGVCGNANGVHFVDVVGGRAAKSDDFGTVHVHMEGNSWLRYTATSA